MLPVMSSQLSFVAKYAMGLPNFQFLLRHLCCEDMMPGLVCLRIHVH